jgi:DNA primase
MNKDDILEKIGELGLRISYISGNQAYVECPFHADRKPSLAISLDNKGWWCFSCEQGGSLSSLKEKMDKADKIFLETTAKETEVEVKTISHMVISDYDCLKSAEKCTYLLNRGLTAKTIKYFGIKRSDLFVVIPIRNRKDETKGLILRAMLDDTYPRYQYTKGLDKNNNVFASFKDLNNDLLIIVEGSFDLLLTWQNGFKNVASLLGSSLSNIQMQIIRDFSRKVLILTDNDDAGKKALKKIASQMIVDFEVYIPDYSLYVSKDPGEMGIDEISSIVGNPMSYLRARNFGLI